MDPRFRLDVFFLFFVVLVKLYCESFFVGSVEKFLWPLLSRKFSVFLFISPWPREFTPLKVMSEYIESKLPPAAVTLRAWHLLDLSDMTFGYMDVENDPLVPKDQRYGWLFGWGFSYMFTRSCWELTPVPDVEWSEDISFYEELKRLKVPVVPVHPPSSSAICAHSYHAKVNTSGGEFAGAVRCGTALQETPKALMDLMPLAEAAASCVSSRIGTRDQSIGEKSGFRVNLSEKREFLQCRGQAWFAYQQQKISDRKTKTVSVATWPSS